MEERYLRQSELVVRCIPSIAEESCFAIKGGTAINLFELDLPRLSVDIDLTFLPVTDRDTAIREINAALEADADVLGIPGLEKLPAIIWKRRNLEMLRQKDARKFAENIQSLERLFA